MTTDMTTSRSAAMKAALLDYVAAFNAADAGRVVALFADDATVEDPVGSPVVAGREAILAFYRHATSLGARLDVVAAPRGSHGNAAALSFAVYVQMQGHSGGCMANRRLFPWRFPDFPCHRKSSPSVHGTRVYGIDPSLLGRGNALLQWLQ